MIFIDYIVIAPMLIVINIIKKKANGDEEE
jgi:hypothetical protein